MEIQYLKRNVDEILLSWSREKPPDRKPLLLRGARQVGKSSAIRQLGTHFKHFVEINFDEDKEIGRRSELVPAVDFSAINRGSLAEIFAGLELIKASSCYMPQELFCWQRSAGPGSSHGNAQVDFLVQKGSSIIPIEVKSGTQGSMQSLRLFMKEKHIERGIRTSLENFGHFEDIDIYPLYAIANILRG